MIRARLFGLFGIIAWGRRLKDGSAGLRGVRDVDEILRLQRKCLFFFHALDLCVFVLVLRHQQNFVGCKVYCNGLHSVMRRETTRQFCTPSSQSSKYLNYLPTILPRSARLQRYHSVQESKSGASSQPQTFKPWFATPKLSQEQDHFKQNALSCLGE